MKLKTTELVQQQYTCLENYNEKKYEIKLNNPSHIKEIIVTNGFKPNNFIDYEFKIYVDGEICYDYNFQTEYSEGEQILISSCEKQNAKDISLICLDEDKYINFCGIQIFGYENKIQNKNEIDMKLDDQNQYKEINLVENSQISTSSKTQKYDVISLSPDLQQCWQSQIKDQNPYFYIEFIQEIQIDLIELSFPSYYFNHIEVLNNNELCYQSQQNKNAENYNYETNTLSIYSCQNQHTKKIQIRNSFSNTIDYKEEIIQQEKQKNNYSISICSLKIYQKIDKNNNFTQINESDNQKDQIETIKAENNNSMDNLDQQKHEDMYEIQEECPQIFSKCNFEGHTIHICDQKAYRPNMQPNFKSIKIPQNQRLELFNVNGFNDKKIVFEKSLPCFDLNQSDEINKIFCNENGVFIYDLQKEDL
ncbi:hypothetical protein PPERSA_03309 [Pseudocohnilembus persalinus]|uniref:Uncharacterized protein n=1 Tax=Pseudocohnilembus persalinus TaxID=266149 RepID=A0A0V0Q8F8_PSEPJ|nr:hypothetical protein PPERSA_03309 [Pseudocohnilembus persalinus]|eukprot:KRW98478.1 hypothetical protein PPERSA_03309 [Pseudocohnilembus persalinus]